MRLVEFLIQVLDAHAQVLQRLAALLDEEALIAVLEIAGEQNETTPVKLRPEWFDRTHATGHSTAYAELENAVHGMQLGAQLMFHLWAYPPYRAFIESEYELESKILGPGSPGSQGKPAISGGTRIVDDTIEMARLWVEELPLPPEMKARAAKAAEIPWLRFRTNVLKHIGRRPLGPVH